MGLGVLISPLLALEAPRLVQLELEVVDGVGGPRPLERLADVVALTAPFLYGYTPRVVAMRGGCGLCV